MLDDPNEELDEIRNITLFRGYWFLEFNDDMLFEFFDVKDGREDIFVRFSDEYKELVAFEYPNVDADEFNLQKGLYFLIELMDEPIEFVLVKFEFTSLPNEDKVEPWLEENDVADDSDDEDIDMAQDGSMDEVDEHREDGFIFGWASKKSSIFTPELNNSKYESGLVLGRRASLDKYLRGFGVIGLHFSTL